MAKREKLEAAADAKIGELCRDGKTVYYVALPKPWRTLENTNKQELVEFLIRNRFV